MSTYHHIEAKRQLSLQMKPWQWAIIIAEAVLLFGVLGALAWMLLFNPQGTDNSIPTPAQATDQPATAAPTHTPASAPTSFAWPTLVPTNTPLPTHTRSPLFATVTPRATSTASPVAASPATLNEIAQKTAALRKLDLRATVPVDFLTRAGVASNASQDFTVYRSMVLRELEAYRALGLIRLSGALDWETAVARLAANITAFYSPQKKRIYLIGNRDAIGQAEKDTLTHEYTHALQDQHFDLTLFMNRIRTTDERLAIFAVHEGDATLVELMSRYGPTVPSQWEDAIKRAASDNPFMVTATDVSPRLYEIAHFPYRQGAQFIAKLWADGKGWTQVNHTYTEPPFSTSIVLHPERYLTQHATPIPIPLPDLGQALSPGWTPTVKQDTLGEYITSVHLDEFLNDRQRAAQAADGWQGDSFTLWTASGNQRVFAWQIAWDTPRDTSEFIEAYTTLLRKRVGSGLAVEREDATMRWYSGSAGSGAIRRIGEQTLILWGPDKTTVEKLLALFK